jgi:hypothetical protein
MEFSLVFYRRDKSEVRTVSLLGFCAMWYDGSLQTIRGSVLFPSSGPRCKPIKEASRVLFIGATSIYLFGFEGFGSKFL